MIFEGIPVDSNDLSRRFRGFIAIDELSFADSSECGAFCTFEGGICGWTQDSKDDFDWTQVRGLRFRCVSGWVGRWVSGWEGVVVCLYVDE